MGYYVETGTTHNKAKIICQQHNGQRVTQEQALTAMHDPTKGVIVVVSNPMFEAAAFAYDMREFEAFTDPDDFRPKQFVVMDRKLAEKLSRYPTT
jgi:hypothetical protein